MIVGKKLYLGLLKSNFISESKEKTYSSPRRRSGNGSGRDWNVGEVGVRSVVVGIQMEHLAETSAKSMNQAMRQKSIHLEGVMKSNSDASSRCC